MLRKGNRDGYLKNPGGESLAVSVLFVPSHLNRFEFAFVGFRRIVPKLRQRRDPLMQIGKPNRQRINVRMRLHQRERYVFGIFPSEVQASEHGIGFPGLSCR